MEPEPKAPSHTNCPEGCEVWHKQEPQAPKVQFFYTTADDKFITGGEIPTDDPGLGETPEQAFLRRTPKSWGRAYFGGKLWTPVWSMWLLIDGRIQWKVPFNAPQEP